MLAVNDVGFSNHGVREAGRDTVVLPASLTPWYNIF